jgi:hypothetical protein
MRLSTLAMEDASEWVFAPTDARFAEERRRPTPELIKQSIAPTDKPWRINGFFITLKYM